MVAVVVNLFLIRKVHSLVEFTNIKCEVVDPDFCNFEYCFLKSVNRTYKYYLLKVNLYKTPVTKVKLNSAIYKFANGYKPFMYNVTVDACKFLKNPKSNAVTGYIHGFFKDISTTFQHDLVVDKLSTQFFNDRVTKILPFPDGKYLVQMNWIAYDILRAVFKIYFVLS
ncbi:uncharacterized protein LOC108112113 [Drosophila eugracilis]|uniref:uncharacterized protein LOC108112113 n=1 Tax=Drosophila eugracilis TaxID=29029 RepID=UPI0007E7448E|nr:uncharacterized protein LOC108112113 [Drosophila eugracilis]